MDFNLPSDTTMNHTSNLNIVLTVHQFFNYVKVRPKDIVAYRQIQCYSLVVMHVQKHRYSI